MCCIVLEEFPDEERDPVYVKEGQGAVLLCAPPKAWPRMYHIISSPSFYCLRKIKNNRNEIVNIAQETL